MPFLHFNGWKCWLNGWSYLSVESLIPGWGSTHKIFKYGQWDENNQHLPLITTTTQTFEDWIKSLIRNFKVTNYKGYMKGARGYKSWNILTIKNQMRTWVNQFIKMLKNLYKNLYKNNKIACFLDRNYATAPSAPR